MTEATKCLDHLETDEGDFFCQLDSHHGGNHQFVAVKEELQPGSAQVDGQPALPFLRQEYSMVWISTMLFKPISKKED
jgi:hypothetical protein